MQQVGVCQAYTRHRCKPVSVSMLACVSCTFLSRVGHISSQQAAVCSQCLEPFMHSAMQAVTMGVGCVSGCQAGTNRHMLACGGQPLCRPARQVSCCLAKTSLRWAAVHEDAQAKDQAGWLVSMSCKYTIIVHKSYKYILRSNYLVLFNLIYVLILTWILYHMVCMSRNAQQ